MTEHRVTFTLPEREIGKADIEIKVWRNKDFEGTLKISKGNVEWFRPSKKRGRKKNWSEFIAFMEKKK